VREFLRVCGTGFRSALWNKARVASTLVLTDLPCLRLYFGSEADEAVRVPPGFFGATEWPFFITATDAVLIGRFRQDR